MAFDLAREYAARKDTALMFKKIMEGAARTFRWPGLYLKTVEMKEYYYDPLIIRLDFNVFDTEFPIDIGELMENLSLASDEKYVIVGEQAGRLMNSFCNEPIPDNVELGEN